MKYSEAEKQIKALSSKYDVDFYAHKFNVYYKNELTAGVKKISDIRSLIAKTFLRSCHSATSFI